MVSARADSAIRPLRLGMVGGGEGAFIGAVHRMAARLDGQFELVAGALSSTPEKALRSAAALGLDPARSYPDFMAMAKREARLKEGIEAVAIVTPNHQHVPAALAFLKAGVAVICDKPLASTLKDARRLQRAAEAAGTIFCVTYNYSGYPMVRQARAMVAEGLLGDLRVVQVEYPQDWLTEPLEATGQKQADWRTDPARAGAGGCIGDIGTHAYQLTEFVTGLEVRELAADLSHFVPGRRVDDNAQILLRFNTGARGMMWASQVAPGNENGLKLRVYGCKGGLEWRQEHPNHLTWTPFGEAPRTLTRGGAGISPAAARVTRVPSGHPEGYLEAFATLYTEVARAIRARAAGEACPADVIFPTLTDGVRGMAFIEAAVRSSQGNARWVKLPGA
ncbi:Gfo/Idh/MocA family protein [Elstera sp.]|uniref:Gfo/Idh/MocA family protein n=1 Tax=Elstera sp. TaxID=1916664 RepID=UPI0037BFBF62